MSERPVPSFASARVRGLWAAATIAVIGTLDLLSALVRMGDALRLHGASEGARLAELNLYSWGRVPAFMELTSSSLGVLAGVAFLAWFHRVHRNLRSLDARDLEFSPDWAIAGFFVPILNLWRPREVMLEVRRESRPSGELGIPTTHLVDIWWMALILSWVLYSSFERRSTGADVTVDSYALATWFSVASGVLAAISASCIVPLIREVDRNQLERHRRLAFEARQDGVALPESTCSSCGSTLRPEAKRCAFCGTKRARPGIGCGGVAGVTFGAVLLLCATLIWGFGSFMLFASPPTYLMPGHRLSEGELSFLRTEGVLEADEQVLWFYSLGLLSMEESGTILSDRAVLTYERFVDSVPVTVDRTSFAEIQAVQVEWGGDWLDDTVVTLTSLDEDFDPEADNDDWDGTWGQEIDLSTEHAGDRAFVEDLVQRVPHARVDLGDGDAASSGLPELNEFSGP